MPWIKLSDRKPEEDCICYVGNVRWPDRCHTVKYVKDHDVFVLKNAYDFGSVNVDVTHWMPLPDPPREE